MPLEIGGMVLNTDEEGYLLDPGAWGMSMGCHPRVYLALDKEGYAQCHYCGTRYQLDAPKKRVESR